MLIAKTTVSAEKSERYFESLSKHFARKVQVDTSNKQSKVHFPMGKCLMTLNDSELSFQCESDTEESIDAIKQIIEHHVLRYGELKNCDMIWNDE